MSAARPSGLSIPGGRKVIVPSSAWTAVTRGWRSGSWPWASARERGALPVKWPGWKTRTASSGSRRRA